MSHPFNRDGFNELTHQEQMVTQIGTLIAQRPHRVHVSHVSQYPPDPEKEDAQIYEEVNEMTIEGYTMSIRESESMFFNVNGKLVPKKYLYFTRQKESITKPGFFYDDSFCMDVWSVLKINGI